MNNIAKSLEGPAPETVVGDPAAKASPKPAAKQDVPQSPPVRPVARPAMRGRHRRLILAFVACVLVPIALISSYLILIAQDRYISTVGFTVRNGSSDASASALLGGLASITGSSASGDTDILNQFVRSQQIVQAVDAKLDLRKIYGAHFWSDPVFSLKPDATIEDLTNYWNRVIQISYDQTTGLMQIEVNAFTPEDAQAVAQEIMAQGHILINAINDTARSDAIRYAQEELGIAEARLKTARTDIAEFRTRTKIVDLQADLQTKMGVLADLQRQLSQEQVGLKDLLASTKGNDPRIAQAERRIDVLNDRIAAQRNALSQAGGGTSDTSDSDGYGYPEAISHFEALQTDQEFAQKAYIAALAALDAARMEAMRQNRYLATYIEPTLAQKAEYPQRTEIICLAFLFLTLIWGIGTLIVYSVREHA